MNIRTKVEEIDLQNKRKKLISNLSNLILFLESTSHTSTTPIKDINDKLISEERFMNPIETSLGISWKDDLTKLIEQELNPSSIIPEGEKLKEKISHVGRAIDDLARNFPHHDSAPNFDTMRKNISALKACFE